jgi:hypothetical protein
MDWIDKLEEDAWNVVIDELVWHLREGRLPTSISRQLAPSRGILFRFTESPDSFFPVEGDFLEARWDEALQILSRFPQLQAVGVHTGT